MDGFLLPTVENQGASSGQICLSVDLRSVRVKSERAFRFGVSSADPCGARLFVSARFLFCVCCRIAWTRMFVSRARYRSLLSSGEIADPSLLVAFVAQIT